jgi:hypothetical protein
MVPLLVPEEYGRGFNENILQDAFVEIPVFCPGTHPLKPLAIGWNHMQAEMD